MPTDQYDVPLGDVERRGSLSTNTNTFKEMGIKELAEVLSSTIACDEVNKCILFLGMLTAYTDSDQLAICLLGESSSGKTYLTQEVSKYFPKEDVRDYAGATPTSIKYSGVLCDDGKYHVNLERLILLFTEMPDPKLLKNLRAVLSHDKKSNSFLATDVGAAKKKTQDIVLDGLPAVVYCSANLQLNSQETTRAILLSPETSIEKIQKAAELSIKRSTDPEGYERSLEENAARKELMRRVRYIKDLKIHSVLIKNKEMLQAKFMEINKNLESRTPRDVSHAVSIVKAMAMLNAFNRMDSMGNIVANDSDIEAGLKLWAAVAETQAYGSIAPVINFYWDRIVPAYEFNIRMRGNNQYADEGISTKDFLEYCRMFTKEPIRKYSSILKEYLPILEQIHLIERVKSSVDGRILLIRPLELPERGQEKKNEEKEDKNEIDLSNLDF